MDQQQEQTQTESPAVHSPSDWAAKLVESSKIAPDGDEQSLAPQEELSDDEDEVEAELESDEPTSQEDQDEEDDDELEADAEESEETEPTDKESTDSSIVADGTYVIDGEEIDGQTLINGIAATKNFAQEKHRLRAEAQEHLDAARGDMKAKQDEYAAGLNFMLGINQQAQQQFANVNWMELQANNPAEYQRLKTDQGNLIANQQQLKGQFDHFLGQVQSSEDEKRRQNAASSVSILRDTHGGEEGWAKRYPELREIAGGFGYKADEFNSIIDHRFMAMADELGKAQAKISEFESVAKKKTANPVKGKKRGNSQRVNTSSSRKTKTAHDKFLGSGKPKDAAAWLMQSQAGPKGRKL
jgi:hypothetical protein